MPEVPWLGLELHAILPCPVLGIRLASSGADLVHFVSLCAYIWASILLFLKETISWSYLMLQAIKLFLPSLTQISLSFKGRGMIQISNLWPKPLNFLIFSVHLLVVCFYVNCMMLKKEEVMRAKQCIVGIVTCHQKSFYCCINITNHNIFSIKHMTHLASDYKLHSQCQIQFPYHGAYLKSSQKVLLHFVPVCFVIAPVGRSFQASLLLYSTALLPE